MTPTQSFLPIIIIGPTASGKTALSYEIASLIGGEIINADMGQFYKPCSIGTAKPDWRNGSAPAHLFDIMSTPHDMTVGQFRSKVLSLIDDISSRGKYPIIVGGSLFYVKSLFFPPVRLEASATRRGEDRRILKPEDINWQTLHRIDPLRAKEIHPHDIYRIERALSIWQTTGVLPSLLKPTFDPSLKALLVALDPNLSQIKPLVEKRFFQMLDEGWIEEATQLLGTAWEPFIVSKGFIGYDHIFSWIRLQQPTKQELAASIIRETMQYAKRQKVFLKSLIHQLHGAQKNSLLPSVTICQTDLPTKDFASKIIREFALLEKKVTSCTILQY